MGPTIRVATVNILNDPSRWEERRALLVRELAARSFDLIALQEVTNPLGASTAHRLADDLGGYSVHVCPKSGWARSREGIAILSRLPVEDHSTLDLGGQGRTAQRVLVRAGRRPVAFANAHFYWLPGAHAARVRPVGRLVEWLGGLPSGTPVIAAGDYNGTPGSPAIALMGRAFASAYAARHGREPDFTCPTALVSGGPSRRAIAGALMRAFTNRPGESWRGTLDYIFVSPQVRVVECEAFLDRPSPHDPGLYASDHPGLGATLEIPLGG
ncbi:MAG: Endonuclease/exonuclease/phosphatase [Planctomycetota bacterium]|nr:Endonuclease/exonuclease/phosphatase [Planctomycetota bacterium]